MLIAQDEDSKSAGECARYAYGAIYPTIGMSFTQIEDVKKRAQFTSDAILALMSGEEPFATLRYALINPLSLIKSRHQIIARKPPAPMGPMAGE
jgi:hypothetical protein